MTGTVQRRRPKFDPALALVITSYALRSCFPTKRRIGLALPAAGALLFALLAQVIPNSAPVALAQVADGGLFGVVLPVGCLVIGDAVLGSEVRSGTLHFTWLSPASFATIVAGRWLAGFAAALAALTVPFGPYLLDLGADESAAARVQDELKRQGADIIFFVDDGEDARGPRKRNLDDLIACLDWNEAGPAKTKIIGLGVGLESRKVRLEEALTEKPAIRDRLLQVIGFSTASDSSAKQSAGAQQLMSILARD